MTLLPPASVDHDVQHFRGCLLAASLTPEAVALLLGGVPIEQARAFQDNALGRFEQIKRLVAQARAHR